MSIKRDLMIGVDTSTTACKVMIWDLQGKPVATGRALIPMDTPQPSWHEQSAKDWWLALKRALQKASSAVEPGRLAAICVCPQRETFVPIDGSGQPIYNAILWMDERAGDLLETFASAPGFERFHQITGKPLSGNLTITKVLWLREHETAIFENAAKFLDVAAYLNHKLSGEYTTGWGIADPTGMFDMVQNTWSPLILDFLGLELDQLPQAVPTGTVIGKVTRQAARACGIPVGLPVVAGLGDGQAAGLGANITRPGQTYLSLGTSVVSGTFTQNYVTNRAFRSMYATNKAYSLETVLLGGTYTLDWFRNAFGNNANLDELETQSQIISPGADGLVVVPYWNSVMNPYWDASASGITIGWRGHHGPAHFYRAILEGIAFELRLHFEGVEAALAQTIESVTAMGGGARSDLWCQLIADVSGKSIQRAQVPEATALGAGIIAAAGIGLFPNAQLAAQHMSQPTEEKFIPDITQHRIYTKRFEQVYRPLFPALRPLLQRLADT